MIDPNGARAFQALEKEKRDFLLRWIESNFYPIKSLNRRHTSYGLKHIIQRDTGEYFTNGEFKGAMLKAGYKPDNKQDLNWCFNVSEKSIKETRGRIDREWKGY